MAHTRVSKHAPNMNLDMLETELCSLEHDKDHEYTWTHHAIASVPSFVPM